LTNLADRQCFAAPFTEFVRCASDSKYAPEKHMCRQNRTEKVIKYPKMISSNPWLRAIYHIQIGIYVQIYDRYKVSCFRSGACVWFRQTAGALRKKHVFLQFAHVKWAICTAAQWSRLSPTGSSLTLMDHGLTRIAMARTSLRIYDEA